MKPGRKISLTYSALTVTLVVAACLLFYFGSRRYISSLYYQYLEEKARVLAMQRYGQDDLDPDKYQHAVNAAADAIPTSQEIFVPVDSIDLLLSSLLDSSSLAALHRSEVVNFKHGSDVGTALLYHDNSGDYAAVVIGRNPYGDEIAHTLRTLLLLFIVGSSVLLWLVSRLWAGRMVNRIDQNYRTERLFVGNAQHEINNPLSAIRGECEVALLRQRTPDDYRSALVRIERQATRIENIMHRLLALGDARHQPLAAEPVGSLAAWLAAADLPQHELLVRADFGIDIDPTALLIAVSNLVSNAVKYGGGDRPQLVVSRPCLSVVNRGEPIPEAELAHIFEPFYRGANAAGVEGHGIGLALARTLLERCGASLSASSAAGTVTFAIRFAKTAPAAAAGPLL